MSRQGEIRRGKDCFVRYPALTYATIPDGLLRLLVERGIGRNGWGVMITLCKAVYSDGRFARIGAAEQSEKSGLTHAQVARGMRELRNAGIIEPVIRTNAEGYRRQDRSNFGHIAQYRFTKEAWEAIEITDTSSSVPFGDHPSKC